MGAECLQAGRVGQKAWPGEGQWGKGRQAPITQQCRQKVMGMAGTTT